MSNGHSAELRGEALSLRLYQKSINMLWRATWPCEAAQQAAEPLWGDGLHQVVIETGLEGSAPILLPSIAGKRDDGRRGGLQETVAYSPGRAGATPLNYSSGGPCLDQSRRRAPFSSQIRAGPSGAERPLTAQMRICVVRQRVDESANMLADWRWTRHVAVSCSFQLTNQAIDSNQNSKSEMHPHQRDKHQHSHLDAHGLCYQQKNNRTGETGERSSHANNKSWVSHSQASSIPARGEAALPGARLYAGCGEIEMRSGPAGNGRSCSLPGLGTLASQLPMA